MSPASEGTWHLVVTETPRVLRHCPRCKVDQPFSCADKFRVNGQGSRIDVWLLYRCDACEETWKLTLYTRVRPKDIPKDLFESFQINDQQTAWRYAFDHPCVRRNGAEFADNGAFDVQGTDRAALAGQLRVAVTFSLPCYPRTEQLVSRQLGLTRKQAKHAFDNGLVKVEGLDSVPKRLSRPVVLLIDLERIQRDG